MRQSQAKKYILKTWKKILGVFITFATIIPFLMLIFDQAGLTLFESVITILVVILIILASIIGVLLVSNKDNRPIALAGHAFISHDESLDHTNAYYHEVEKVWDLRENGKNITMIKRLHGYTTSQKAQINTSGHSKYGFAEDNIKAYEKIGVDNQRVDWPRLSRRRKLSDIDDRLGNDSDWNKLETKSNKGKKEYEGIYDILFNETKEKSTEFAVEIEAPYGARQLKPEKFIFFTYFQYKRGVESVNCRILLDTEPDNVVVSKISNSSDAAVDAGVQRYDLREQNQPVDIEPYGDAIQCQFTDSDPEPSVYVVNLKWNE